MKNKLLYIVIGFAIGLAACCGLEWLLRLLKERDSAAIVCCQGNAKLAVMRDPKFFDLSYFCPKGSPEEIVFHDDIHGYTWIIDNVFFHDFDRDGIADARVNTNVPKMRSAIRVNGHWIECISVSRSDRTAVDQHGRTLKFNGAWQ